ncbi:sn-glycerol-3-phosphate ABC transporter ATP-binding protein UgpC [bacterium]|nr:sn-glycerol-3-phosphate ABC transporter ATP-binding protein UgpC [bacterium]
MASLSIKNVKKTFGSTEVLKGVSIQIESGEFLILVGPSGCGKSTLLNLIAGLETITSGEILIGDRVVNNISPKDRDIAMVFQNYALYPNMTVKKNISFGLETRKVPKQEIEETVQRVASLLQIEELLDRKPAQLSGGQRQRVAMGRAISRNPAVFLFDEPLSNLDAKLRVEMRTEIKHLHQRINTTIVYVTHDQIEAMTMADRIAIMKDGIVQQFDTPQQVYDNPSNMFVAGFMGSPSMNFIKCRVFDQNGQPVIELITGPDKPHLIQIPSHICNLNPYKEKEVILGIRPEKMAHGFSDQDNNPDIHKLHCTVSVIEPTGPDTLVIVKINDKSVTCRVQPADAALPGEKMILMVDMSKAIFFDPETENRIN